MVIEYINLCENSNPSYLKEIIKLFLCLKNSALRFQCIAAYLKLTNNVLHKVNRLKSGLWFKEKISKENLDNLKIQQSTHETAPKSLNSSS